CLWNGVLNVLVFSGAGAFLLLNRGDSASHIAASDVVAGVAFGLCATQLYLAIAECAWPSTHEERFRSWRALTHIDQVTLARFEGELAAQAGLARSRRRVAVAADVGLIATGGALLALALTSDLDRRTQETIGLSGGAALLLGVTS